MANRIFQLNWQTTNYASSSVGRLSVQRLLGFGIVLACLYLCHGGSIVSARVCVCFDLTMFSVALLSSDSAF